MTEVLSKTQVMGNAAGPLCDVLVSFKDAPKDLSRLISRGPFQLKEKEVLGFHSHPVKTQSYYVLYLQIKLDDLDQSGKTKYFKINIAIFLDKNDIQGPPKRIVVLSPVPFHANVDFFTGEFHTVFLKRKLWEAKKMNLPKLFKYFIYTWWYPETKDQSCPIGFLRQCYEKNAALYRKLQRIYITNAVGVEERRVEMVRTYLNHIRTRMDMDNIYMGGGPGGGGGSSDFSWLSDVAQGVMCEKNQIGKGEYVRDVVEALLAKCSFNAARDQSKARGVSERWFRKKSPQQQRPPGSEQGQAVQRQGQGKMKVPALGKLPRITRPVENYLLGGICMDMEPPPPRQKKKKPKPPTLPPPNFPPPLTPPPAAPVKMITTKKKKKEQQFQPQILTQPRHVPTTFEEKVSKTHQIYGHIHFSRVLSFIPELQSSPYIADLQRVLKKMFSMRMKGKRDQYRPLCDLLTCNLKFLRNELPWPYVHVREILFQIVFAMTNNDDEQNSSKGAMNLTNEVFSCEFFENDFNVVLEFIKIHHCLKTFNFDDFIDLFARINERLERLRKIAAMLCEFLADRNKYKQSIFNIAWAGGDEEEEEESEGNECRSTTTLTSPTGEKVKKLEYFVLEIQNLLNVNERAKRDVLSLSSLAREFEVFMDDETTYKEAQRGFGNVGEVKRMIRKFEVKSGKIDLLRKTLEAYEFVNNTLLRKYLNPKIKEYFKNMRKLVEKMDMDDEQWDIYKYLSFCDNLTKSERPILRFIPFSCCYVRQYRICPWCEKFVFRKDLEHCHKNRIRASKFTMCDGCSKWFCQVCLGVPSGADGYKRYGKGVEWGCGNAHDQCWQGGREFNEKEMVYQIQTRENRTKWLIRLKR